MAGQALTTASTLMCPHGGTVSASPANVRAKADAYVLTVNDAFVIAGCAFTLPNGQPSPCMSVMWTTPDSRVKAGGPTLSASSVGLCTNAAGIPQGPVSVSVTQAQTVTS
jgi:hypothetical protein